mgnify:CR=1 FL=1
MIFGYDKVSSGASGDIQYATGLARDMVTKWGMSDKVGPVDYAQPEGESFLGYSSSQPTHMSNETAQLIDAEIKAIVEGGLHRAKHVLTEHIDQLHLLAGALLEYETLSGEEIKKLIAGEEIGRVIEHEAEEAETAIGEADGAFKIWRSVPAPITRDLPHQKAARSPTPISASLPVNAHLLAYQTKSHHLVLLQ